MTTQHTAVGGGPLRGIEQDEMRPDGERALAGSMITFMQRRQALHAKPFDLGAGTQISFAQLKLLFHLPATGSIPLGRLADAVGITPAALTQSFLSVEEAGLAERHRSTSDRRVVQARMTDAGRDALARLRALLDERWRGEIGEFDDAELALAARVLDHVSRVFDPPATPQPRAPRS
jgi:DNA-binding MarR family transcriptional regulator